MNNQINFNLGAEYHFGSVAFTKDEIIAFAQKHDPLPFHTDEQIANKGFFKGIIAAGAQPFNHCYLHYFIPNFGSTVVAGLGLNNWKFLKPVYPNQSISFSLQITSREPHAITGLWAITWHIKFTNKDGEDFQTLDLIVLHKV
ncbi:MAG: hypothetical protein RIQ89_1458 [Bacteroidota bacterium]|jgi:acyl dehydratase